MSAALRDELAARIAASGPMPVAAYMARCLEAYYAGGTPIGAAGDFITAPEVSQMFGEIVGAWAIHVWETMGAPSAVSLVEFGPGRGTLAADIMRLSRLRPAFAAAMTLHLVEKSPGMRRAQKHALSGNGNVVWHDSLATVPAGPLIVIANEFFDALPVRQFVHAQGAWRERAVSHDGAAFAFTTIGATDAPRTAGENGTIVEHHDIGASIAREIGRRIHADRGACLLIDYGYAGPATGDTLQAMRGHEFAGPLDEPGSADLTTHVDFTQLADAARAAGALAAGPLGQGEFLTSLGIALRADALAKANPARRAEIEADLSRLVSPDAMGALFKLAVFHDRLTPVPPPFRAF